MLSSALMASLLAYQLIIDWAPKDPCKEEHYAGAFQARKQYQVGDVTRIAMRTANRPTRLRVLRL